MSNPFLDLQDRVAALLAPAFPAETILTERLGDLPQKVERLVLELGFGLVVTTAKGEDLGDPSASRRVAGPLGLREELTVALVHNPLLKPERNILDALWAACSALHGQPAAEGDRAPVFRVLGHEARDDAPEGLVVHHLRLAATLYLAAAS